jgi:putative membrane-bound dehydrogenase-like protein
MRTTLLLVSWTLLIQFAAEAHKSAAGAENIPRVRPLEPANALQTFRTREGLHMDLIAHEPLVTDPVAIAYDENGAMYVAEMSDYPYPEQSRDAPLGQVKLLFDNDGDGNFDEAHVFVDKLRAPSSVICWKGGVFVASAPDLWYFRDTDGDHRADVRRKVFSGFGAGNPEQEMNSLQWGIDNRIYGAGSHQGGDVRPGDQPSAEPVSLRGRDFCFDPDTDDMEPLSGGGRWGNSFDDWYNRFVCENIGPTRHIILPMHYLARNPFLRVPAVFKSLVSEEGQEPVYRTSPPEPWRVVRAQRRTARGKDANPGEINPAGFFTSACGITIYRGGAYPKDFLGMAFIGEVAGNLVHRRKLVQDGVSFSAHRIDEQTEIVTSSDIFFRPVNFCNAPDGTLHIVDMYREVVEGPSWVPEDLKKSGQVDIMGGQDKGRIYRLAPAHFKVPAPPQLGKASVSELVAQLENANSWWRETAQRLIYERQDKSAVEPLRKLMMTSELPLARLHALWSLQGLKALRDEDVLVALADQSAGIPEHAVRLAEPRLTEARRLLERVLALASDESPRVRLQVAFTLGAVDDPRRLGGLFQIAQQDSGDPWIRTAVLSSATTIADRLFERLIGQSKFAEKTSGPPMLRELAFIVGARNRQEEIDRVLLAIAVNQKTQSNPAIHFIVGLAEGLGRVSREVFERHLSDPISVQGKFLADLLEQARRDAPDRTLPVIERRAAVTMLRYDRFSRSHELLMSLINVAQPEEVQLEAVRSLVSFARSDIAEALVDYLPGAPPGVRSETIESLLSIPEWTFPLLEAIRDERLAAGEISPTRQMLLLKHENPKIRQLATALFDDVSRSNRHEIIARYRKALELPGDSERGRVVFEKVCTDCHRIGEKGHDVGHNLSTYSRGQVSAEGLLVQILDPNREVSAKFLDYVITLDDGRTETGLIAAQTPASITLRRAKGVETTILRQNIELMKSTGKSLMPEGLEKNLTLQEMADLLVFLQFINERL